MPSLWYTRTLDPRLAFSYPNPLTNTHACSLGSLAYTWSACTCASVLARFKLIHTERHDYASLVIWQGVTIDWVPRQGLPIKFSLQNSLVPRLTFKQRRDNSSRRRDCRLIDGRFSIVAVTIFSYQRESSRRSISIPRFRADCSWCIEVGIRSKIYIFIHVT